VFPGKAGSAHLAELPRPEISDVPDGRGVRVEVLRVGVDGTDREIQEAEYGQAPAGSEFLVLGHESLGRVVEVGPAVTELQRGDPVGARVRRPGASAYAGIGMKAFTTDDEYFGRGISRLHGFLTEEYVDSADWLVKLPPTLSKVGVLLEPMTVVEKGIGQAFEAQRRLKIWRPRRAAVLGAGTIGLMATLVLRLRGLAVATLALSPQPNVNASLVEATGARYVCGQERNVVQAAEAEGGYDLVFECSGFSPLVFDGMRALSKNGVLVLSSITGGGRKVEVPSDHINQSFVLG